MRLVIAVVERKAAGAVVERLRGAGYPCTRLASSGGFLQRGNVTLFAGVEEDQVDGVMAVLAAAGKGAGDASGTPSTGVAFVTRVNGFRRL